MILKTVVGNFGKAQDFGKNNGSKFLRFSVAVNKHGDDDAPTKWVNCKVWGKPAEIIYRNYVDGDYSQIIVNGKMDWWEYEGKDYEILNVDNFEFGKRKNQQRSGGGNMPQQSSGGFGGNGGQESTPDEDLPF